ncbi:Atu4866 domain-containing protein [Xanthomonas campestris pv. olitorii]|uniref:Atu4866 domain-containing protein n=1 Tax=Xanthomonas axonopodis TaxID=53413 RepID=UPI001C55B457|nr:Atu4866 domain-containing protein [Xanthomonas campestris pv. olitorii]
MKAAIAVALRAGSALACPFAAAAQPPTAPATIATQQPGHPMQAHPYLGMWVTGDGRIRQELLPNGRYDEARGTRQSAYQGRYEITGTHIEYWDDTGFTADGRFVTDDELHHGGMVFYRQPPA